MFKHPPDVILDGSCGGSVHDSRIFGLDKFHTLMSFRLSMISPRKKTNILNRTMQIFTYGDDIAIVNKISMPFTDTEIAADRIGTKL